jgi:hypothetical protein
MATTLQVDGAITSSAGATITVADNSAVLTLVSTSDNNSLGPRMDFKRDSSSPADNDDLGYVVFSGENDADEVVLYAQIFASSEDVTDGSEDGSLNFLTMSAGANKTITMVNGNIDFADGSGTRYGASNDLQIFHDATDSKIVAGVTGNLRIENSVSDADIIFGVNDGGSLTEVARFDGSAAALVLIDGGGSQLDGGKISVRASGSVYNLITTRTTRSATGTNFVEFFNSSGQSAGKINHNGSTSVSYTTSSDYRLKENVVTEWDATTRLKQLKPSRFNFIAEADKTVDGFLAHEVSSIVPEAITGTKDEIKKWNAEEIEGGFAPDGVSEGDNKLDDDGNTIQNYQAIDQSKLVPLLVKTVQELEARIKALEDA